ncbi:MAG: OadG family protein [Deltaproteobacteria bacterium]|nr:OadG family protein [Deltaproteobacteria bacterium]MBN2672864.1 OadG family protein [Deltaproteobacteria bacterium]
MIGEGLELMVAGMSVVFLFLALMVIVMSLSAGVLKKFEKPENTTPGAGSGGAGDPMAEVAVAIAAVQREIQG